MSEEEEWYYNNGTDDHSGPVSRDDLVKLFRNMEITKDTLVWNESMEGWEEVGEVPSLLKDLEKPKKKKKKKPPAAKRTKTAPKKKTKFSGGGGDGKWMERKTIEGMPYYYNEKTEELTWDKPDALKSRDSLSREASDWSWQKDETEGWVPTRGSKGKWSFKPSELKRLENDVVMLEHINEAMIVHNIKERYRSNDIYTWCGASKTVLISVNPFQRLPLYTPKIIEYHRRPPPNQRLGPHVYDIANKALNSLMLEGKNQSILISGESGAGKTECAKQCFSFLAEHAGSDSNVEQLILAANPLLEAFGNAKTLRNNNSSRFGKWVEINFDPMGKIVSAKAQSFLLEKIRVVNPADGERNFHIFYQMFSSQRMRKKYGLGDDPSKFRYLSASDCYVADGIDDVAEFEETQRSATALGFKAEDQSNIFDTVAGILHLSTIKFVKDGEGCKVKSAKRLERSAKLLKLDAKELERCITTRGRTIAGKTIYSPLSPSAAKDTVDALSKSLYGKLFLNIVSRVNAATQAKSTSKSKKSRFIGVLDIFGFEIFENNSFEQLCINYANEKLQQFFNKHTFKEEESVYESEQIKYTKIKFIDNQPVLDLIEKKRKGLLPLLDDVCRYATSQSTDAKWLDLSATTAKKMKFKALTINRKKKSMFKIAHYAGDVTYSSKDFVDKNKDTLFDSILQTLSKSKSAYIRELYPKQNVNIKQVPTISERFRKNLKNLMKMLDTTSPLYIRCIKPNQEKKAQQFDAPICIEQLRNSGVFEAVAIRKSGFPFRLTHKQFCSRYRCVLLNTSDMSWKKISSRPPMYRDMCEELLGQCPFETESVQIGKTMVLYKADIHRLLELKRYLALDKIAPICQRVMRGHLAREMRRRMMKADKGLVEVMKQGNDLEATTRAIDKAGEIIGTLSILFPFEVPSKALAVKLKRALKEWREIEVALKKLSDSKIEDCYDQLGGLVGRGNELVKKNLGTYRKILVRARPSPSQAKLLRVATKRIEEAAKMKLEPALEDAMYVLDRKKMLELQAEAKRLGYESDSTKENNRLLELSEEEFAKLELKKSVEFNDPVRKVNREIFLEMRSIKSNRTFFVWNRAPILYDPSDWASKSWNIFSRSSIADGMLVHSSSSIHAPLTKVEDKKTAKLCHKAIISYCEKKPDPYVAKELIESGLESESIATEIYFQLMKHLSRNPSPESTRLGWALFGLCLSYLKISREAEWYMIVFLLDHAAQAGRKYISTYHELKYREILGESGSVLSPSASEVDQVISSVDKRIKRSRFSMTQSVAARAKRSSMVTRNTPLTRAQIKSKSRRDVPVGLGHAEEKEAESSEDEEEEDEDAGVDSSKCARMCAAYDFEPQDDTMIEMTEGDTMILLCEEEGGWVRAENERTGRRGYVPMNYLE